MTVLHKDILIRHDNSQKNISSFYLVKAPYFIRRDTNLTQAKSLLESRTGHGPLLCQRGLKYPTADPAYTKKRRLQRTKDISVDFEEGEHSSELMVHFAWDFLGEQEKVNLCKASPVFSPYAKLRYEASMMDEPELQSILTPLPHKEPSSSICKTRSWKVAKLLLLCDFDVGCLIRRLGGQYTGDFLDFPAIDKTLSILKKIKPDTGQPPHDYKKVSHLYHQGIPTFAHYSCKRKDTLARNLYNNHKAAHPHLEEICEKVAADVQKSYALALPRWIFRFIDGVFLAAVGWASRVKNGVVKGRQVNDPSAHITGEDDTGAVNDQIPRNSDCPSTHYANTLERVMQRTYNLRISNPFLDIILYKDDLVTAFRRICYHPDVACAHSFVLDDFFIIPIGLVFGACDSPGWFCQSSEIRAFASQHYSSLGLPIPDRTLIDLVAFDDEVVTEGEHPDKDLFTKAFADSKNKGLDGQKLGPQNSFVDDTIIVELASNIRRAAIFSVLSAVLFIGDPEKVEEPISVEKFERWFRFINEVLGFVIDSRELTIAYPKDKRDHLLYLLRNEKWSTSERYGVRDLSTILGTLRNVATILPLGTHLSIQLQQSVSKYVGKELIAALRRPNTTLEKALRLVWNNHRKVHLSKKAVRDLNLVQSLLQSGNDNLWKRPISLLIPRDPHFIAKSDACSVGLGGFSPLLNFQWRLSANDLNARHLHINMKEFLALFINVYLCMIFFRQLHRQKKLPEHLKELDGWIFNLLTDNTTAMSWMTFASRLRTPQTDRLSFLLSYLIFKFNNLYPSVFKPQFLPGVENGEADALSRPQLFPSFKDIFNKYPHLKNLTPVRLPSKLTSLLKKGLSTNLTREQIERDATTLLSVEGSSLKLTAQDWASTTLAYEP